MTTDTTLPDDVSYGKITGRFVRAVGDTTADTDTFPDSTPSAGTVTFTPSVTYVLDAANQQVISPEKITCTLDAEGYITDETGARGVYLIATDSPGLNPSGFTYKVVVTLGSGATSKTWTFNIDVPSGSERDISQIAPVPASGGTPTVVGPAGPANDLSIGTVTTVDATDDASAQISGDPPTQTLDLWIPRGPQGEQGEPGQSGVVTLTQAEYDALDTPAADTLYVIHG